MHLDPTQTEIHWTLAATLHTVHGTFKLKSGLLTFDPISGVAQGELVVDLRSGSSGNDARDRNMQEKVLETSKYPEAVFHLTNVQAEGAPGSARAISAGGNLNIHGSDHPMKLPLTLQLSGTQATATTHFALPYVEWGMNDPSTWLLRVSKVVDVDVTAKGTVDTPH